MIQEWSRLKSFHSHSGGLHVFGKTFITGYLIFLGNKALSNMHLYWMNDVALRLRFILIYTISFSQLISLSSDMKYSASRQCDLSANVIKYRRIKLWICKYSPKYVSLSSNKICSWNGTSLESTKSRLNSLLNWRGCLEWEGGRQVWREMTRDLKVRLMQNPQLNYPILSQSKCAHFSRS